MALLPASGMLSAPTFNAKTLAYDSGPNNTTSSKNNILPDADAGGDACASNGWTCMQNNMADGDGFLAKGPDGALFFAEFDAELSTAYNPVIRKKYG